MKDLLDNIEKNPKKPKTPSYSAKDIEVLEGLEPVRKRPGMYIGGTDEKALHHLAAEVLDNAMDEVVAGHANTIHMCLEKDGYLSIRDNGRGIPVDPHPKFPKKSALEVILTTLHSGGKFSGDAYETSGGLHGVGISVVNALSEHLIIEVTRDQKTWRQEYRKGVPVEKLSIQKDAQKCPDGTFVSFKPDQTIFDKHPELKPSILYKMARSRAYLHSGVKILWKCDAAHASSVPDAETFHFPEGISDFLNSMLENKNVLTPNFFRGSVKFPSKEGRVEWSIAWIDRGDSSLTSYCNTVATPAGGTHELGFRHALLKGMREFGDLLKNKKASKITADDVLSRSVGIVSVFIKNPQFQGQTKEKLSTSRATKLVETAIRDHFDHWLSDNLKISESLLESMIDSAEMRERQKQEREENRKTPTQRLRLPGKLADCSQSKKEGTELFLVEGDSAGGSAKTARDRSTQAILPLRGKILNVAHATADKMRNNQEILDIEKTLGCGTRTNFNIEKLRYEKIIIMTDADVDGAHIASLLMTYFYKEMKPLIEHGHLYLAQPPLYRLHGNGKTFYVHSEEEKEDILKKEFKSNSKVHISRFKGLGEMGAQQLKNTTMSKEKRSLLQVSLEHFEDKTEDVLESFVEDLMGKKPEKRYDFIQKNAHFVENIDI
ncbi:MAG: DNA topoisomerase IV subunit B [Holosporaceae bacterium]|nr:MAG: DNA topoisomerase IV subunit B [Holosporaceae bacterium]